MAEYQMTHSGAELDEAVGYVLDNYKDVTPVTARAQDVVFGKIIVTPEGPVMGTYQGVVPPASWRKTASGEPVTISDGMADWPLYGLSAEITPTQSGSGDPSPTNVRPIGGRDGVEVTQNGAAAVSVEFPDDPGTVYGGVMDFKTGVLTVDRIAVTYDGTENWTVQTLTGRTVRRMRRSVPAQLKAHNNSAATFEGRSNILSVGTFSSDTTPEYSWWYFSTGLTFLYCFFDPTTWTGAGSTDAEKWKAFLAEMAAGGNPLTLCVPLAEPVTYQLTPQQMPDLVPGTNSFAADTGGVTVTYYSVPDDPTNPSVQSLQSNPVSLSMAAPTADPMDEPEEVEE